MNLLLIGYDLNKTGQNYDGLIAMIKNTDDWWHGLDSTWIVKTTMTPEIMRNQLQNQIDENDEILVIDITGDAAAWRGFSEEASRWLRNS
jgi:hypothetical protein